MSVEDRLPPILSLIDDHDPEVILSGLLQLRDCLHGVSGTELARRNWGDVIYDALVKVIHQKDPRIVRHLGEALLHILPLVEQDDPQVICDKLTKYDATLKRILFTLSCSGDWGQKGAWLTQLEAFVGRMGHASMHYVDQLNSLLLDWVSGSTDVKIWIGVLEVIQALIKNTWMKPSCSEWTRIILKILFNQAIILGKGGFGVNLGNESTSSDLYRKVRTCFLLMSHCDDYPETRRELEDMVKSMRLEGLGMSDANLYQRQFLVELDKCQVQDYVAI